MYDYREVGGRVTQGAVTDDYRDVGGRVTQGAVTEEIGQQGAIAEKVVRLRVWAK